MSKIFTHASRAGTILALVAFSAGANAAFTFSNDNSGDGTLTAAFPSFEITGSDNGVGAGFANVASYVQTFESAETVTFDWRYLTLDSGGADFDPAGYLLNGVQTVLSLDADPESGISGRTTVAVRQGDTFGWYVASLDSEFGRGVLGVTVVDIPAVPEPSGVALVLAGIIGVGFAATHRRKRV